MKYEARTVLEAMSAVAQVEDRGFRFADTKGELFISFKTLTAEVRGIAASFQMLKLSSGDRLAIIMPDHRQFIIAFLAALSAGLIPVLMYPPVSLSRYENWNETAKGILGVAGASAIVTVAELRPLLWSTAAQFNVKLVTLEDLANEDCVLHPIVVGLDDLAFLQFTSGSTGAPRGVMVSHRNILANCNAIAANYHAVVGPYTSAADGCCVSWLPLYHDMGLIGAVLAPLFAGQSTVFLATLAFLKRPTLWLELIHRHRGTVTFAPNFAFALCARRVAAQDIARWDLSCLKSFFVVASRSQRKRFGLLRDALLRRSFARKCFFPHTASQRQRSPSAWAVRVRAGAPILSMLSGYAPRGSHRQPQRMSSGWRLSVVGVPFRAMQ